VILLVTQVVICWTVGAEPIRRDSHAHNYRAAGMTRATHPSTGSCTVARSFGAGGSASASPA